MPLPKGVEATGKSRARLSGEVSFRPELIFRYDRRGGLNLLPERAAVGLGGSYSYGWQVHGKVRGVADTGQVAVPLAAVTGRHVFWVGPVPVVVSTEVTFTYRFTAGGRIVLDADQRTSGSFAVGAQYDRAHGWQPLHTAQQQTKGPRPGWRARPPRRPGSGPGPRCSSTTRRAWAAICPSTSPDVRRRPPAVAPPRGPSARATTCGPS
ncbi:hypothetical protein PQR15_31200 [Streptomyces lydicus]|nr:hypothetical protein [Streptomyces lydicus]